MPGSSRKETISQMIKTDPVAGVCRRAGRFVCAGCASRLPQAPSPVKAAPAGPPSAGHDGPALTAAGACGVLSARSARTSLADLGRPAVSITDALQFEAVA